jgi:Melibiase
VGGGELLLPGEISLGPAEEYATPWLYASYGRGLDAMASRFHSSLRSLPGDAGGGRLRPVILNTWEAVYFNHEVNRRRILADRAAEVGVERLVLDDGWFRNRRDLHGVVAPSADDAVFALVAMATGISAPPGRVKLPGLAPDRAAAAARRRSARAGDSSAAGLGRRRRRHASETGACRGGNPGTRHVPGATHAACGSLRRDCSRSGSSPAEYSRSCTVICSCTCTVFMQVCTVS